MVMASRVLSMRYTPTKPMQYSLLTSSKWNERWLFAFLKRSLTVVQIKSQVSSQQQTKQPSPGNIQHLKILGTFVSGCVFLLLFFLTVEIMVVNE